MYNNSISLNRQFLQFRNAFESKRTRKPNIYRDDLHIWTNDSSEKKRVASVREDCTKKRSMRINSTLNAGTIKIVQSQDRFRFTNMGLQKDPLPTATKFCFLFELKPAVAFYILVENIVWILFLLSSLNLELDCLEKKNLIEFENVLRRDLYYNLIFGEVDTIPHDNARCKCPELWTRIKCFFNFQIFSFLASVIFLNTVLVAVFLLYFIFTPFLLVGILKVLLSLKTSGQCFLKKWFSRLVPIGSSHTWFTTF